MPTKIEQRKEVDMLNFADRIHFGFLAPARPKPVSAADGEGEVFIGTCWIG